jgi:hypothetical protein
MDEGLKRRVRDRYAGAARSVLGEAEDSGSCCGGGAACCGVVESGERAAFEVDMAFGSYSELLAETVVAHLDGRAGNDG